ncbi:hypothetical protein MA16_Dca011673 [Dendrobium catenatum]|uniref:Uncharacterized protein n=1 Tax=Dendrobium catenatum TaxID=906689 RepID=A0A2I0WY13_9ASPA|nr:hypothetical protein MA16_Dca011673 [Dendrobium catenatum]
MEKSEFTRGPSMCEKLFNAFSPMKPLRRLSLKQQELQPRMETAAVAFAEEDQQVNIQNLDLAAPPRVGKKPRRNKSLNEKAEEYIARTKMKLRSGSTVGKQAG